MLLLLTIKIFHDNYIIHVFWWVFNTLSTVGDRWKPLSFKMSILNLYNKLLVWTTNARSQPYLQVLCFTLNHKLKLVRTPLNVYFTAFKSSFLSLYAHINSDECHAWFHLNAASQAVRNAEQVNITKKFLSTVGFEPPTPAPLGFQRVALTPRLPRQLTFWY